MDKKHQQLGMNAGTASHRLVKDILFSLVKETPCFRCGQKLTRETFSIEHKVPWLDSEDPIKLFFDLSNISFSHQHCNSKEARKPNKLSLTTNERIVLKRQKFRDYWNALPKELQQTRRKTNYQKNGC